MLSPRVTTRIVPFIFLKEKSMKYININNSFVTINNSFIERSASKRDRQITAVTNQLVIPCADNFQE